MDYTDSQKKIIECDEREDQVVIAVPGAGKTTCIMARIKYLHFIKKIPLDKMCYLTYSKRMASDALSKLKQQGLDDIFHAGTIDSLCWKLLENGDKRFSCEISQIISETKNSKSITEFAKFFENPQHVFVDEAQDIDYERFQILSSMFNTSERISCCRMTIVGDPRQAIYQGLFQADPELMLKLRPSATIRQLTDCFRCSPEILNFVNEAFSQMNIVTRDKSATTHCKRINFGKSRESTVSSSKPNLIKYHAGRDNMAICRNEVVDLVVKRIKQLIQKGSEPHDIMVIAPSIRNTSLQLLNRIRTGLMNAKIPSFLNKSQPEYDRTLTHIKEQAVYMGTVHSVKGLECKHMLILNHYVGNGAFSKVDRDGNLNPDYNNLLYVAYTRAKDTLDMFETCHIPAKCEAIESVSGSGEKQSGKDDMASFMNNHYNVICIRSCPLKNDQKMLTKTKYNNHIAVTDILKNLSSHEWGLLQNLPVPNTTKCLSSLNRYYRHPKFLTETRDCDIYGIFMELIVTRHLAQTQRNTHLMKKLRLLPLILTISEYDLLFKNAGNVFCLSEIPSYKFKYSLASEVELCEIFRLFKQQVTPPKNLKLSLKTTLARRDIYVSEDATLFYDKVQEHHRDLENISDDRLDTADQVLSIWNVALLKIFRETQLGLYWLQTIESQDLLPNGVDSWSIYLDEIRSLTSEFIIEEYQRPLRSDGLINIQEKATSFCLTGIADLKTRSGDIIDIKCSVSDRVGHALYNRTQLAAYRSMSTDCDNAFILSLFTLNLYKLDEEDALENSQATTPSPSLSAHSKFVEHFMNIYLMSRESSLASAQKVETASK